MNAAHSRPHIGGIEVLGHSPDDAEEWVRSWTAQVSAQAEAAATLADRVAGLSATATGVDGAVRVTVASTGAVTDLRLDDRVHRLSGADLAAQILAAMRRAQAGLADQVAAAVRDTVGPDSESGRAVLHSFAHRFPEPPPEADVAHAGPGPNRGR